MWTWTRLVACVTAIAALAGCAAQTNSTIKVTGTFLTIYASNPPGVPGSRDIVDAERLALKQAGTSVGKFTIRVVSLPQKPTDNARTAVQDSNAIAYIGELSPGDSAGTLGITNDQDLLQVTPTDTAIAETHSTPAVPGAPNNYYQQLKAYGRTFARVVPSGVAEARAQVAQMRALAVKKLYVADDGSDYGRAIAYAVKQDASADGIAVVSGAPTATGVSSSGADALFYGASPGAQASAQALFAAVAQGQNAKFKLFAPSALDTSSLASSLGSTKANLYVSEPGFEPKNLGGSARQRFLTPFEATYGHAPSPEAIFGYEAMSAVLAVLRDAGSQANNRSRVVHDFFAIHNRASVLGTYSINSMGDTNISPFVFSRLSRGTLVPYKFVPAAP
jgi:ABC-type branched-subunit amino acid transport system substrate-binding protein